MAFDLEFYEESASTTIDLHSGEYRVISYYPREGDYETVSETIMLEISGTSATDVQSNKQAITRMLEQAALYTENKRVPRVFIRITPNGYSSQYRSLLMGGRVELYDGRTWNDEPWWSTHFKIWVRVHIERRDWWETIAPVPLNIANAGAPDITCIVLNHDDDGAGHDNWVSITGTDILGDLPAPACLTLINYTNDANYIHNLFVGQNVWSFPSNLNHILCATGSATAGACHGETAIVTTSATALANEEILLYSWSVAPLYFNSGYFRPIVRLGATFAYTDLWLKCKLLDTDGNVIGDTGPTLGTASENLQILNALKLLPYNYQPVSTPANVTIGLYCSSPTAGAHTVDIDFIQLTPLDGWRQYKPINAGMAYNCGLYDFPTQNWFSTVDYTASTEKATHIIAGGEIMLIPKKDQRLYFLFDLQDGSAPIAHSMAVSVTYYPRRRSL